MRGGRNKFGPMYKRDRARKLQMMRQRQLALQTIRGTLGDPANYPATVTPFLHIKQEIQIPQVSSLTSSPDSSPSPAAVAAGLVTTQAAGVSGVSIVLYFLNSISFSLYKMYKKIEMLYSSKQVLSSLNQIITNYQHLWGKSCSKFWW
jgi:hypothetical protein